jgi:hypothetical protein
LAKPNDFLLKDPMEVKYFNNLFNKQHVEETYYDNMSKEELIETINYGNLFFKEPIQSSIKGLIVDNLIKRINPKPQLAKQPIYNHNW